MATPREPSPLPPSSAETATLPPEAVVADSAACPPVPGYEVLGELGRGGMGVVYKARQAKLGRLVALKMILAGGHAGAADLARFRTEAEAIARLQHPNIVQIHEVGELDGLPYFSLEFCAGGSLEKKLAGTPLPPKEAAALVETLARAMQAAHDKGVIHRDLKPANVLLAADGTPKITDFGLAKKLGEAGQTASGAIMGTPSYMAPEQAGYKPDARAWGIGPAADVYALGAILYECLTDRPPFKGPTAMDTIMQVVADEPVPVRRLQPQVPADVETVCLMCLRKEAGRRYGSAAALADDLRCFLEGRPIVARPVGWRERSAKWVGRNPALAGAIAAGVLALLAGTGFSTGFGVHASRQAEKARANESAALGSEEKARTSEAEAVAKGKELATTNETLKRTAGDLKQSVDDLRDSRDTLEVTLARSLLRPLAAQGGDPISDTEWDALWELATTRDGRVSYRFVEEASRTPKTSRQLRDRAAPALSAAVRLDDGRRAAVEKLLLARLADPALRDEQKWDLALALATWDGLSGPAASGTARQLIAVMTEPIDPTALSLLAPALVSAAGRLEPEDAALAAAALIQAIKGPKNLVFVQPLAEGLSAVAARLGRKEGADAAAEAAAAIVQAIKNPNNAMLLPQIAPQLAKGLAAVAPYLGPKEGAEAAAEAAAALTRIIKGTRNAIPCGQLAQGLSSVAPYLGPREAALAAAALIQAMRDTTRNAFALPTLGKGLSALAARMEPREAAQAVAEAAAVLTRAIMGIEDATTLPSLVSGLSQLAPALGPEEAARIAASLTRAMQDAKEPVAAGQLARGVAAVAGRLGPEEAARAATTLVLALQSPRYAANWWPLAQGLSAVAARLGPGEAALAAAALARAIEDPKNALAAPPLARGLSALAARLEPREAAQVTARAAAALMRAIKSTTDEDALQPLLQALSSVAAQLEPREVARAAAALTRAMTDATDASGPGQVGPGGLTPLAQGLSQLAAYLEPREAALAAAALLQPMQDAQAAVLSPAMQDAIDPSADPTALRSLAQALSALLSAVPPADVSSRSATAASVVAFPTGSGHSLMSLALLIPAAELPPCRLLTQQLVELLKMPTCVGEARRIVLDRLGKRYQRTFADPWEFVRFAREQGLDLDFTTPPQRPEGGSAGGACPTP